MSRTAHLLILHPQEPRLLALPDAPILPCVTLAKGFLAEVAALHGRIAEAYDFPAQLWVLYCLGPEGEEVVFVLESQTAALPPGACWLGAEDLAGCGLEPKLLDTALAVLLEAAAPETLPPLRSPWMRRGWFAVMRAWVEETLTERGYLPLGLPVQLKQWSITSLWKVRTDRGEVYAKAVPPLFAGEARAMHFLSQLCPGLVPAPLACDNANGWLLLEDFQGVTLRDDGTHYWTEALRVLAELQLACVGREERLLASGFSDRRLARLERDLHHLLNDLDELRELTPEERAQLAGLEPRLRQDLATLAAAPIPMTFVHGDFSFGNSARSGDRVFLFDLTDACVSHPFFDLLPLFYFENSLWEHEARKVDLLEAYLSAWTAYAPLATLYDLFTVAFRVSHLHHAYSYHLIHTGQEDAMKWESGNMPAYILQKLLSLAGS